MVGKRILSLIFGRSRFTRLLSFTGYGLTNVVTVSNRLTVDQLGIELKTYAHFTYSAPFRDFLYKFYLLVMGFWGDVWGIFCVVLWLCGAT